MIVKINNLEKQKSRLQSEVEVLIIDLEKVRNRFKFIKWNRNREQYVLVDSCFSHFPQANGTARELQKRVEHLERINIEIKTRLDETTALFEQAQRDLRNKQAEVQRLTHELDKTREQKDALTRENKKLAGEFSVSD